MLYLIGTAVLLLLIAGFWYYGQKPAIHRRLTDKELNELLRTLLNQGYQGGALFIRGRGNRPFLQVMKYIGRDRSGLQLDFPKADWSRPVLADAEMVLLEFNAKPTGGWTDKGNDLQFLTVDFGTNVERASQCIRALSERALGIDLIREGRAHFENVSSDPRARIGLAEST